MIPKSEGWARLDEDSKQIRRSGGDSQRHSQTTAKHQSPNLLSIPDTHPHVVLSAQHGTRAWVVTLRTRDCVGR